MTEFKEVMEVRDGQTIIAEIKATVANVQLTALTGAIKIGKNLHELKELIPHGEWSGYIQDNLNWNERKVQRFMKLADEYGEEGSAYAKLLANPTFLSDLNVTNALALLAIPEDEVAEFVEEHVDEDTTNADLAEEIKKYKEENAELTKQVASLKKEVDEAAASEEGVSPEEVEKIKTKLEKAKEKLKKEKENKDEEIEKAKQETMAEVEEKVRADVQNEIDGLNNKIAELEQRAEEADRRATNSAELDLIQFKTYCDECQKYYDDALSIVDEVRNQDPEKAGKMLNAMKNVIRYMEEAIEEMMTD